MLPEGWSRKTLEKCAKFLSGNTPSKDNAHYWNGDFPWVTARDMKSFWLNGASLGLTAEGKKVASIAPAGSASGPNPRHDIAERFARLFDSAGNGV